MTDLSFALSDAQSPADRRRADSEAKRAATRDRQERIIRKAAVPRPQKLAYRPGRHGLLPEIEPSFIHDTSAPAPDFTIDVHGSFIERHVYRTPAKRINRDAIMPAAKLFASCQISRKQLLAMIDGDL